MRDLPGPRSGIRILYDVLQSKGLLDKETLIRVCDLLASDHLAQCLSTPVYKADFNAYNIALESLPSLDLGEADHVLAKEILATLYLWYEANSDRPQKSLSIKELAEATLMTNTGITPEDNILWVLDQIQSLSQIKFEGDSAQFIPLEDVPSSLKIFREYVRKAKQDPFTLASTWNESLQWKVLFTHGQAGLFSDLEPDRPVTRSFDFRNFQYAGEVILGSQWHLDWGMQITGEDQHFRFVFMEADVAERVRSEDLQDPRIAVIYPTQLTDNANEAAANYLAWKRMSEAYQNQSGRDADLVRGWLNTQQQVYVNDLLLTQLGLYRNGTVITRDSLAISAREIFERVSFDQRIGFMVEKVLSAAYKQPLVDGNQLRSILTAAEAGKVFEGYFGKNPGPAQTTATRNYGVGLGLSTLDQPAQFAPHGQNPVLAKMAELLVAEKGRDLKVYRIFDTLSAPPHGLPYIAIQLYILAFIRQGNPRTELALKFGHRVKTRNGQPFAHGRITAASIAELQWKPDLSSTFDTIIPTVGPNWNDVLPYARQFVDDLRQTTDQSEIELETVRLVEKLVNTEESIQQIRGTVQVLERVLNGNLSSSDQQALSQINQLAQCRETYESFYEKTQAIYPSSDNLREEMKALVRIKSLGNIAAQVAEVKRYLDGVVLRDTDRELNLQKTSLLGQIDFNNLATQPHLWDGIEASFQDFKRRYRNEIQKHHRDTNIELENINTSMEDIPNQLRALSLLNGISELGSPLEGDLSEHFQTIVSNLKPCSIQNYLEVNVDSSPVCDICQRKLTYIVPTQEIKEFQKRLTAALSEQQRRLASETIRRVLDHRQGDALERFIQVIQAANLNELVRVLDENIVHAIRQLLVEEQIMWAESPVMSNFLQKYHSIEEKDIPAAVEEFKKLLVAAFNDEKRNHPDKKTIRLSLK